MTVVDTSNASASAGVDTLRTRIAGAIKQAADTTGASFQYLLTTAKMESDFNPKAAAPTSSASGLFQFIQQTWLGTVKEAGNLLGYGKYADAISKSSSGSYSVNDPSARNAIMQLRNDPVASSEMAAVLTQANSSKLTGMLGRRPTDAELYMAHFMGVDGAAKLIANAQDNPQASAVQLFPDAAAANRPIFFDSAGRARSVSDVYAVLTSRYAAAASSSATQSAMESVGSTPSATTTVASADPTTAALLGKASFLSRIPDVAAAPSAAGSSDSSTANNSAGPDIGFRSLYQVSDRPQPVSATVQRLWGAPDPTSSNASPPQPLDLFSDRKGAFSS
ncbi:MAG TPA: transglycosylase SLT domain-containing protein [Bradyrhizobium sp.]|nr:transglycosylase SLT domain-containing protein [Bradyrhizobium sp.]